MLALLPALALAPDRIGHATRAQIMAVLPPSLKADPRDPQGEGRYARLVGLGKRAYPPEMRKAEEPLADAATHQKAMSATRPILDELEKVLQGPVRVPLSSGDRFPESAELRMLSKLVAFATREAASGGDPNECERDATLGLRLSKALVEAKGDTLFLTVATATEAIATRVCFDADVKGGLSDGGRARALALMPSIDGPMPEAASALRSDFYERHLPWLVDLVKGYKEVYGSEWPSLTKIQRLALAKYDPVATARLVGREYDAAIADSQRPFGKQTGEAAKIAAAASKALPFLPSASQAQMERLILRVPNAIGIGLAAASVPQSFPEVGIQRATRRNLVRAAILLRHGEPAVLPDPYGKGPLRVDAKRRIVYSVGENGKDDGGQIGRGFGAKALDRGCRY